MVDVPRLSGFDHESGAQPRPAPHQVVVHSADCQQRRYGHSLRPQVAIGEDQDVCVVIDVAGRLCAQVVQPQLHPVGPRLDRPGDVERGGVEHIVRDLPQLLELVVAQDRLVHDQLVGLLGGLGQEVGLGADAGLQ